MFKITNTDIIKYFESLKLKAYNATAYEKSVGKFTIGYGHVITGMETSVTIGKPGQTISEYTISKEEAEELLLEDVNKVAAMVHIRYPFLYQYLTEKQMNAIGSFVYNIGIGNFAKSKVLEKILDNDIIGAAEYFKSFTKQNGKRLLGLVRRRAAEKYYYLNADDYTVHIPKDPAEYLGI